MQDRYAGDIGDFMKFGLLRALADESGLRLGVNWYLTGDESHNADGKHVTYLDPANSFHASLKRRDPDLMARLAGVVAAGPTSSANTSPDGPSRREADTSPPPRRTLDIRPARPRGEVSAPLPAVPQAPSTAAPQTGPAPPQEPASAQLRRVLDAMATGTTPMPRIVPPEKKS